MTKEDIERRDRKPLLVKYDIPLNHLEFAYIKELKNIRELEKIYKILKSGEVGHFPELNKCAEDRLRTFSPNHRLLRKSVAALSKDCLDKSERNSYLRDITDWKDEMEVKEALLRNSTKTNRIIPPVRRTASKIEDNVKKDLANKKDERIKAFDYKSWDNYDAEKECLKIDLEEEKMREEREKMERIEREKEKSREKMSMEEAEVDAIKDYVYNLSTEEREVMALKEKDIGNEYYKTQHLNEAIKHYTRSIYIHPTVSNYNNRAMTYLKQCKFSKALADLNIVLQLDPNNVKARHRRAVAYQHKNEFQKALEDIRFVLAKEPRNILARHFAERLIDDCSSLPKKHKLCIKEVEGDTYMDEVTEQEMLSNYKDQDFVEVNEFDLPKIMCNCNGKYVDEPGIRHEDNVRFQHIRQRKQLDDRCPHQGAIAVPYHSTSQTALQPVFGPERKPALVGGGKRLDIVELDSIYEESDESISQTTCIVRDMRTVKDEKTNANLNIAQASSSNNADNLAELDSSKTDKTTWNKNIKESVEDEQENDVDDCNKEEEEEVEETNQIDSAFSINEDIPRRADIVEMMESVDVTQTDFDIGDKESWTEQWLHNSVSSVNSDFGKCMDLNEIPTIHFEGLGEGCSTVVTKLPDLENCRCTLNLETMKPQNYLEKWNKAGLSEENSLRTKAFLLRSVCPLHIPEVFSLNLSEAILNDIVNCLYYFYEQDYNKEIILNYVRAIIKLQRFKIIVCFISEDAKLKMKTILTSIGSRANDIQRAFGCSS